MTAVNILQVRIKTMLRVHDTQTKYQHESSYLFENIDASIVNGLRRILLSELPHIAMDQETISNKNTVITHNTSSLHNELLINRLALIPLNNTHPLLTVHTHWDSASQRRVFSFAHPDLLPKMALDVIHSVKANFTSNEMLSITPEQFVVIYTPEEQSKLKTLGYDPTTVSENLFAKDPITGQHCLFTQLKPADSTDDYQRIALTARPIIGTGKEYASFSQVGTVMYELVRLGKDAQDKAFSDKMSSLNEERVSKDMKPMSAERQLKERVTFDILDAQRVYSVNAKGEPNLTQLTIQSINSKTPNQLLYDAIEWFILLLNDFSRVIREMSYVSKHPADLDHDSKADWVQSQTQMQNACELNVRDETHTLGAVLSTFCKQLFVDADAPKSPLNQCMTFMSYNMPHPLKKCLRFRCKLDEDKVSAVYAHLLPRQPELGHPSQQRNKVCSLLLLHCCDHVKNILQTMSTHLKTTDPQIYGTSYVVEEKQTKIVSDGETKEDDNV